MSLDCSQCQTPGQTNAQAGPLPASGVPRPDIPPTAHLHQPPTSNSPPWEGLSSETFGWEPIIGNGEITEKLNPWKGRKVYEGGPKKAQFQNYHYFISIVGFIHWKKWWTFPKKTWSKVDYKSDGINRNWNRLRSIAKVPADAHLFNPNKVAEVKFPRWLWSLLIRSTPIKRLLVSGDLEHGAGTENVFTTRGNFHFSPFSFPLLVELTAKVHGEAIICILTH